MIVLGISPLDKDATVSILVDGKVVYAAGEERFTRIKLQDGFPSESLEAGLKHTGIRLEDIDVVAYPFFEWQKETELFTKNLDREKEFLEEVEINAISDEIKKALSRVPKRTQPIHGLKDPNQKMEKGPLHKLFYRMAGPESVISRNVARKGSSDWGREATKYHKVWQEILEENLRELGLLDKLKRYDHHQAHAAGA